MPSTAPATAAVRKASLLYFVFVMYSYTTGGPFGFEEQVSSSGPGVTLLYHLLIPFFWCIPISLVAAELTTAMPVQGGFYRWVRAAFGDFWGFLAGWWNWTASFLLGAVYAVLFADYLAFYFPQLTGRNHYLVAAALVALVTYINVRGIQMVGRISTALTIFVLLPMAVLTVVGLAHWHHNPFSPLTPPGRPLFQVFGVGLALGVWLYSGYEQLSSVAEEVENPRRTFPRALAFVVPLSIATYFLPTLASLAALGNWQEWHNDYFSVAAKLIGGSFLGGWVALAAMIANASLLNATVLATTRMPFAMAEDKFLPRALTRIHPRYGTPAVAIIVSGAIYALFSMFTLLQLISVYAWLRVATSLMTVLAAWKLRRSRPDLPRPFAIPARGLGLLYAVLAPVLLGILATAGSVFDSFQRGDRLVLYSAPAAILLGPAAYAIILWSRGAPSPSRSDAKVECTQLRSMPINEKTFWLDTVEMPVPARHEFPERVDVAVIGAGYTGLSAARALAKRGAKVAVFDSQTVGWGASSRNGGMVLTGLKLPAGTLISRYGKEATARMFAASLESIDFVEGLVREENIACDFARSGHLEVACKAKHFHDFQRSAEASARDFGHQQRIIPKAELPSEIGSTIYHGGLVDESSAGLNPARYVAGLASAAERAGAQIFERARVEEIQREGARGWKVATGLGTLRASDVLVATSGYTSAVTPLLQKKIIPIGSYIIVTEALPDALAHELSPRNRMIYDSKNYLHYYRLTPDRRMLFGGRAAFFPETTNTIRRSAEILQRDMLRVYPQLRDTKIEYVWGGTLDFAFDIMPHIGIIDGMHFSLGYAGHGVAMSTYLGDKIAHALLDGTMESPFARIPFPGAPLGVYNGKPWFLPFAGAWFKLLDWFT